MDIFERILAVRGIASSQRALFLLPDYSLRHDPFLLPDMKKAVDRLTLALERGEKITIYGDYDIDGLTATASLLDAFRSFGFRGVEAFIPNRFTEGYGLTVDAVERIAKTGADIIVTVDCGSLSHLEIARAGELGIDVIVTDHHNVAKMQPPAVAVINPKRLLQDNPDSYQNLCLKQPDEVLYPFLDLPGVGVAFKLIQALQTRLGGLPPGQEKWLLDLVALGTVCDVVTLIDENRTHVYWGLEVMRKTRRPGLKALMAVAGIDVTQLNARALGFGLGPRLNAAGRLETAQYSLDLLTTDDPQVALELAYKLNDMNQARRREQDLIFAQAIEQADRLVDDPVLVVSAPDWNHGVVGIVAAKLLERYKKPTFVLSEVDDEAKGSARSYGDFSAADAIRSADDIITKGGGHKLAAGVTLPKSNIGAFRQRVNDFYRSKKFTDQPSLLLPRADVEAHLSDLSLELSDKISQLEPFGNGNERPIFRTENVKVLNLRRMGDKGQHLKLTIADGDKKLDLLAFNADEAFFVDIGQAVTVWYNLDVNQWNGRRTIEGHLLHLTLVD